MLISKEAFWAIIERMKQFSPLGLDSNVPSSVKLPTDAGTERVNMIEPGPVGPV
jgi:hypothetical protein